jgi:hypothetical protein
MSAAAPEMVPVSSSNLKAVGYDAAARELHVEFKNGGRYVYANVGPETHAALMGAKSKGSHLADAIKGKHPHRKIA